MNTPSSAPQAHGCRCGHNKLPLILSIASLVVSILTLLSFFVGASQVIEQENNAEYGQVGTITGDNDAPAGSQPETFGFNTDRPDEGSFYDRMPQQEGGGGGYQALPDEPNYPYESGQSHLTTLSHIVPMLQRYDDTGLKSFVTLLSTGGEYTNRDLLFSVVLPDTWVVGPQISDGYRRCPNTQDFIACLAVHSLLQDNRAVGITGRPMYVYVVRTDRKTSPAVTDLPAKFIGEVNGHSFYLYVSGDEYGKPGYDTPEWKQLFDEGNAIRKSFLFING